MLSTDEEDVLLLEEPNASVNLNIRHTKDFRFVTVNVLATTFSKVTLWQKFLNSITCCWTFFVVAFFWSMTHF